MQFLAIPFSSSKGTRLLGYNDVQKSGLNFSPVLAFIGISEFFVPFM